MPIYLPVSGAFVIPQSFTSGGRGSGGATGRGKTLNKYDNNTLTDFALFSL